jgi:hypothetical protein
MTGTPAAIVFVLFVAGMIAYIVWVLRKRKNELALVKTEAQSRNWQFMERDDSRATGFESLPFGRGHSQHASDVLTDDAGSFSSFTYTWRTGSGDSKNSHTRRITALQSGAFIPRTEVEPQTIVAKVETAAAGGDLDVELADFNRAWSVRAADPRVSHALLHPRMVERIMAPDLVGRGIFFEGGYVAIVDYVIQTPQLVAHTEVTIAILEELGALIPGHLAKEFS